MMAGHNEFNPRIVAFVCFQSACRAADLAADMGISYPDVECIRVPCSGKVDILYILKAFENGADGVMVVGCQEGNCKDISGNVRARKRVEYARRLLEEVGLERERLKMYHLAANRGVEWAEVVTEMFTTVKLLGPSAVRKQGEGVRT